MPQNKSFLYYLFYLFNKLSDKNGVHYNIAEFTDPDYFQKQLRSHWQLHPNVSYCLYGSKRHMMMEVFTDSSRPFYKFGNLVILNKIDIPCLVEFFKSRFADTVNSIFMSAPCFHLTSVGENPAYFVPSQRLEN